MKIIDFHAHIYPEKIASKAVESIGEFYNIEMDCDGTVSKLLAEGSAAGVNEYVVHSVAVTPHHVETINSFILSECAVHPEFHGFATMHAGYEDKVAELERVKIAGLKGVKIHPDTQKFNLDDERMYELYDYLQQNKLPLLIHTGDYRYTYSHPARLKKLLHLFPDLIAVGAHFGGWSVYDLALEYLENEKCYMDTSSSFMMLGLRRARELIRLYGAERMLFGTDFPMWHAGDELSQFLELGLTDEENQLILHKNAEKLLNI